MSPARSASVAPRWVRRVHERLGERVGVHRGADPPALAGQHQRAARGPAPDVDRQVVAHLVDEQVPGAGRDLVEPVVFLPPAAHEDAGGVIGQEVDERAQQRGLAGLRRLRAEHHASPSCDDRPERRHQPAVDRRGADQLDRAHRHGRLPVVAPPTIGESGGPGARRVGHQPPTVGARFGPRNLWAVDLHDRLDGEALATGLLGLRRRSQRIGEAEVRPIQAVCGGRVVVVARPARPMCPAGRAGCGRRRAARRRRAGSCRRCLRGRRSTGSPAGTWTPAIPAPRRAGSSPRSRARRPSRES